MADAAVQTPTTTPDLASSTRVDTTTNTAAAAPPVNEVSEPNTLITRTELNKALINPATQDIGTRQRLENPVIDIQKTLELQIKQFEAELDAEHEVLIKAASFGSSVIFYVDTIEFSRPNIIIFHGKTPEDERIRLIQHVNQLNFLLQADKRETNVVKRPIGFITTEP